MNLGKKAIGSGSVKVPKTLKIMSCGLTRSMIRISVGRLLEYAWRVAKSNITTANNIKDINPQRVPGKIKTKPRLLILNLG